MFPTSPLDRLGSAHCDTWKHADIPPRLHESTSPSGMKAWPCSTPKVTRQSTVDLLGIIDRMRDYAAMHNSREVCASHQCVAQEAINRRWPELVPYLYALLKDLTRMAELERTRRDDAPKTAQGQDKPDEPRHDGVVCSDHCRHPRGPHAREKKRYHRKNKSTNRKGEERKRRRKTAKQKRLAAAAKRAAAAALRLNCGYVPKFNTEGILYDIAPHFSLHGHFIDLNTTLLKVGARIQVLFSSLLIFPYAVCSLSLSLLGNLLIH